MEAERPRAYPVQASGGPRHASFHHRAPYLLGGVLAVVWGVHWVVSKVGLTYVPPLTYGAVRVGVAVVALAVPLAVKRRLRFPSRRDLPVLLAGGLGQVGAVIVLTNLALPSLPAGRSALLAYTTPLWVTLIQLLVLRTRISARDGAGVGAGLVGIAILLNPVAIDWRAPGVALGSALMLVAAAVMGTTIVLVRHHRWTGDTLDLMFWECLLALVPLMILALTLEPGSRARWTLPGVACVLFSGVLGTAFAYWASQSIQRALSPIATSVVLLAVPLVGIVSGVVLLGESLTVFDATGIAMTLAGIAILTLTGTRTSTAPAE